MRPIIANATSLEKVRIVLVKLPKVSYIQYIPLTLYRRRGSRGISDIPPRQPRFSQNYLAMRNTVDVISGKPIVVLLQSISVVNAINALVAFTTFMEERERCYRCDQTAIGLPPTCL
jgi:hypothetical protein